MAKDDPCGSGQGRLARYEAEIARLSARIVDLKAILDSQPDMICRFLPDTRLVYVNRAFAAHFRIAPERLLGRRLSILLPQIWRNFDGHCIFSPAVPDREVRHETVLSDGSSRWTLWHDHAVFDSAGRLRVLQSIGRDVTREWLTELALRNAEERLRLVEPPGTAGPLYEPVSARRRKPVVVLSRRERQVAHLIAEGKTNKQIATALNLRVPSVKVYATSIFRKLEVRNRTEAAAVLLSRPIADSLRLRLGSATGRSLR
jgi:PAS domain S-box-containing protein